MTDPAWRTQIDELVDIDMGRYEVEEARAKLLALLVTVQAETDRESRIDEWQKFSLQVIHWANQTPTNLRVKANDRIKDLTRKEAKDE